VHRSLGIAVTPGSARPAERAIQRIVRDILDGTAGSASSVGTASAGATVAAAVHLYTHRLDPPGPTARGIVNRWAAACGARRLA
jgi:hypothetical protein